MKAKVIGHGGIVHLFKDNRRKKQAENVCSYHKEPAPTIEGVEKDLMKDRTIGLAILLTEPYQKLIQLPEPILWLLNQIREPRNTLHFHHSIHYTTSNKTIKAYKEVDNFITVYVKGLLQQMMGK